MPCERGLLQQRCGQLCACGKAHCPGCGRTMARSPDGDVAGGKAWVCHACSIDVRYTATGGEVQVWREPPPLPARPPRTFLNFPDHAVIFSPRPGTPGLAVPSLDLEDDFVTCDDCGLVFAPATSAMVEDPAPECPGCRAEHLMAALGDAQDRIEEVMYDRDELRDRIEQLGRDLIADSAVARAPAIERRPLVVADGEL